MDNFDSFWEAYPRKVAKRQAETAWRRIKPKPELVARILAHLEAMKASEQWTRDGTRFIPHPTTYLHQERWTEEIETRAPRLIDLGALPD